jgi:hypothetical protein
MSAGSLKFCLVGNLSLVNIYYTSRILSDPLPSLAMAEPHRGDIGQQPLLDLFFSGNAPHRTSVRPDGPRPHRSLAKWTPSASPARSTAFARCAPQLEGRILPSTTPCAPARGTDLALPRAAPACTHTSRCGRVPSTCRGPYQGPCCQRAPQR